MSGFFNREVFIDRSRWNFDEDGFSKATNAALLQAEQNQREEIKTIWGDIKDRFNFADYQVTVGGVDIDKKTFEQENYEVGVSANNKFY